MSAVLGVSGGSARPIPTILKRTGFLSADNSPTELYSRFKSEGSRSQAAYEGLRNAFPEIFRRNDYAHKLSDDEIRDILVEITGLNKNDPVIRAIFGTYASIKSFIDLARLRDGPPAAENKPPNDRSDDSGAADRHRGLLGHELGLHYNINIVLPATDDANVLNAIFRSLRDNLLR